MRSVRLYAVVGLLLSCLVVPDFVWADAGGGHFYLELLFGSPDGQKTARSQTDKKDLNSENCDKYDGVMGMVNGFFCHMEKDMGITGVGSKTVVFGNKSVHAEVVEKSQTITIGARSVTTTYEGRVWVCSAGCTSASNFARAYYIAFAFKKDGTINAGYVVAEPGMFEGTSGSAMSLLYDLGSSTSTKFVDIKAKFTNGGSDFSMRAVGTKTGTVLNANFAMSFGATTARFAGATDIAASPQYLLAYYERPNGFGGGMPGTGESSSVDGAGTGSGALGQTGLCMLDTPSGSHATLASVSASNCSSLTLNAFDVAASTVAGYTQSGIEANSGTAWNGMDANPSAV